MGTKGELRAALDSDSPIKVFNFTQNDYETYDITGDNSITGGHGGGDPVMLNDIFNPEPPVDPYKRAAGYIDGCMSILTGIAGNKSIATGMPVEVKELVDIPNFKKKWAER